MSLWTEQVHEEHLKDLLEASVECRIARQEKERRRKNRKMQRRTMIWSGFRLFLFRIQLRKHIEAIQAPPPRETVKTHR
jgi:hypothetical protein